MSNTQKLGRNPFDKKSGGKKRQAQVDAARTPTGETVIDKALVQETIERLEESTPIVAPAPLETLVETPVASAIPTTKEPAAPSPMTQEKLTAAREALNEAKEELKKLVSETMEKTPKTKTPSTSASTHTATTSATTSETVKETVKRPTLAMENLVPNSTTELLTYPLTFPIRMAMVMSRAAVWTMVDLPANSYMMALKTVALAINPMASLNQSSKK